MALNPTGSATHATADVAAGVLTDTATLIDRANAANLDVATACATRLDDDQRDSRLLLADASLLQRHRTSWCGFSATIPRRTGTATSSSATTTKDYPGEGHAPHRGGAPSHARRRDRSRRRRTDRDGSCRVMPPLFAQPMTTPTSTCQTTPDHPKVGVPTATRPASSAPTKPRRRDERPDRTGRLPLPAPTRPIWQLQRPPSRTWQPLAPQVPVGVSHEVEKADLTLDEDVRTWLDPHGDLPSWMLLGPLTVRVSATGNLTTVANRKPYPQRTLAYLATPPPRGHHPTRSPTPCASPDGPCPQRTSSHCAPGSGPPRAPTTHIPGYMRRTGAARARGKGALRSRRAPRGRRPVLPARSGANPRPWGLAGPPNRPTSLSPGFLRTTPRRRGSLTHRRRPARPDLHCAIVDVAHPVTHRTLQHGGLSRSASGS